MYLALVLLCLLKETSVWGVAERFQLSRGFVQTLLSSAAAFCSCALHFTEVGRTGPGLQRSGPLRRLIQVCFTVWEMEESCPTSRGG